MSLSRAFTLICVAVLTSLCAAKNQAHSQPTKYPSRQVKVVIPFPPGGVIDVVGRIIAQKLSERLGQAFYVENRAGAAGNIGAASVQAADPDGYTIMFTSSSFVVTPGFQKVSYDPIHGFEPISVVSGSPSILAVHPSLPATSITELVDLMKKEPGKYSYASPGVGSPPHLQVEMFKRAFALDITHVPFGGGGPALQSAVSGHTPIVIAGLPPAIPLIKAGNLRGLAIFGRKRASALPDIPTMEEANVPGQDAETLLFALAPANTPKDIVDTLSRELNAIISLPEVGQQIDMLGFLPLGTSPEQAGSRIKSELDMWAKVIKDSGLLQQ